MRILLPLLLAVSAYGADKHVLVEDFESAGLGYCPRMHEALMHIRADYPFDEVAVVCNHAGDSYSNDYSNYRKSYCAITGYPTALVNYLYRLTGTYSTWEQNYTWISMRVDNQLNQSSPGTLNIVYDDNGGSVDVHSTFCLDDNLGSSASVWMLVYEDQVDSYGLLSQGGTTTPESVSISDPGEYATYDWTFNVDSGWDDDELNLVAFVQYTSGDKAVIQVDTAHLYLDGTDDDAPEVSGLYPSDGQSSIPVGTPLYFHIFDQTGVNTSTLDFSVSSPDRVPERRGNALSVGHSTLGEITGTLDVDDSDPRHVVCTFTPDDDLPMGTEITCTVDSGLADTDGNTTTSDMVWTFDVSGVGVVGSTWGQIKALSD